MGCFLIMTKEDYNLIQIMAAPSRSSSDSYSKVAFISPRLDGVLVHVQGNNRADTQRLVGELKSIIPETRPISNEFTARPHYHHIFPQQYRDFFENNGIPIDEFTIQLDSRYHGVLHRGRINLASEAYNDVWSIFIDECRQQSLSSQEIKEAAIRYAGQLLTHFDIAGLDINRHRNHKK